MNKKFLKTMGIIFLADFIQNIIFLFFFNVSINKQTLILSAILTVVLSFLLKYLDLIKE